MKKWFKLLHGGKHLFVDPTKELINIPPPQLHHERMGEKEKHLQKLTVLDPNGSNIHSSVVSYIVQNKISVGELDSSAVASPVSPVLVSQCLTEEFFSPPASFYSVALMRSRTERSTASGGNYRSKSQAPPTKKASTCTVKTSLKGPATARHLANHRRLTWIPYE